MTTKALTIKKVYGLYGNLSNLKIQSVKINI